MSRQIVIDVSYWSGVVDWNKAKAAGAAAMYAKASQLAEDPTFPVNWKAAKGILPRGAYHYLDFHISELVQAKLFTDTMAGDWGELPPCLDLEQDPSKFNLHPDVVQGKVWNWLEAVEKTTGHIPMIYCGYYYWQQWMTSNLGWSKYPFWLAWYTVESIVKVPPPWKHWSMWQYTGNGKGPDFGTQGLSLDMSYCDDLDALKMCQNSLQDGSGAINSVHPAICPTCGQPWPV
jgi:lysozyme